MPNRQKSEPGRRTRQRILDTTLALYNEHGEPQVSTSLIAAELGISAGNLHYHFRRKDELSAALLDRFVAEFEALLPPAGWRADHVEDAWLLLHLLLESLWRYRFLFRDLCRRSWRATDARASASPAFSSVPSSVARGICLGLVEQGIMTATGTEIDALSGEHRGRLALLALVRVRAAPAPVSQRRAWRAAPTRCCAGRAVSPG